MFLIFRLGPFKLNSLNEVLLRRRRFGELVGFRCRDRGMASFIPYNSFFFRRYIARSSFFLAWIYFNSAIFCWINRISFFCCFSWVRSSLLFSRVTGFSREVGAFFGPCCVIGVFGFGGGFRAV